MALVKRAPLDLGLGLGLLLAAGCSLGVSLDGYSAGPAPGPGADGGGPADGSASPGEGGGEPGVDADASPMLAYATQSGVIRHRRWDAAAGAWSAPVEGPAVGSGRFVRGVALARSTVRGVRTLAVYSVAAGVSAGELVVYDWKDGAFVEAFRAADFGQTVNWRPFDLACDGKAGNTYVVYGGAASGVPRLRVRDAAGWGPERAAFGGPPSGASLSFTELVTRPGTDDLALLYTDGLERFHVTRWSGSSFEVPLRLATDLSGPDHKAFAGAYERKSGDLLITYANKDTLHWVSAPAGATAIPDEVPSQHLDTARVGPVALAPEPDPASDRIALSFLESVCGHRGCDDWSAATWTGAGFGPLAIPDPDITQTYADLEGNAPVAVGWAKGQAIAVYYRDSGGFRYARWRDGAWGPLTEWLPRLPIGPKASFVPFRSGSDLVMLVEERSGKLWAKRFDGERWSDTEGDGPLANDLPDPTDYNGITFAIDAP